MIWRFFLYLKFRFYSFVFPNLSLHSVFSQFCFCKRTCDQKKSSEFYCQFFSWIYLQVFDNHNTFQDIIGDEQDFTSQFNKFFRGRSLFSLDVCNTHSLWINTKKAKIFGCTYAEDIRTPNKLFRIFLSILIRLYRSYFLYFLKEVKINEEKAIFFQTANVASFLYDFCLHVSINYFNLLFHDIKYLEDYKSNFSKTINKHFAVDLT